jgi:DeoR/GlpR family transcriptional regulator of sugar metabolism
VNIETPRTVYILKQIDSSGSVYVADLARDLDVSEMTIRRDLIELERSGLIRRVHGGAVSARGRSYEPPLYVRNEENKAIKERLGKYAAEMVVEGDSISLDIGSTIFEMATQLVDKKNLTILTPSFHIAGLLFNQPDIRIMLPGGILRHTEGSMIGELALSSISNYFVDRLFLGVGAIDAHAGFTEYNPDDAQVKRAMIKNAKEIFVVADSSKFQKIAFSLVSPLSEADHLITNEIPPEPLLRNLKNVGVVIHVVDPDGVAGIISAE